MAWSSKWDNGPHNSPEFIEKVNKEWAKTFDTPKPFGQVMKEFNEEALKKLEQASYAKEHEEINGGINPIALGVREDLIIVGVDTGSPSGDKTIVSIRQGNKILCIGEDIEIHIPEGWNDVIVKAIQIGDLAVVTSDNEHCIAHVPTQTWFDNAIPDGEYTVEQLCLWAWKVQQCNWSYWAELHVHTNQTYKELPKSLLKSFKSCCLSVPVL